MPLPSNADFHGNLDGVVNLDAANSGPHFRFWNVQAKVLRHEDFPTGV
jgi:hypothetical protein